jgi:hypothetical protein
MFWRWRHIPEGSNLHSHHHENVKSCTSRKSSRNPIVSEMKRQNEGLAHSIAVSSFCECCAKVNRNAIQTSDTQLSVSCFLPFSAFPLVIFHFRWLHFFCSWITLPSSYSHTPSLLFLSIYLVPEIHQSLAWGFQERFLFPATHSLTHPPAFAMIYLLFPGKSRLAYIKSPQEDFKWLEVLWKFEFA